MLKKMTATYSDQLKGTIVILFDENNIVIFDKFIPDEIRQYPEKEYTLQH